ncbi:DUF1800 family protein [Plantactinospora sp. GCM10030261]|uniref:DUF1800 domain-containing protein n=1 Tax=Plantactinospora sp. GCM10030261 TaxID=3273420 RepID=UPI003613B636
MAADVSLLLHRAGFGPTSAELAAARTVGYAATVAALTAPTAPDLGAPQAPLPELGPDPFARLRAPTLAQRAKADEERRQQTKRITLWWLDRLTVATHQTREKLWFFWHGHWATSVRKVIRPQLMLTQHKSLRSSFDFGVMAHRMISDPALIYWLDGQLNTRTAPNENLGRELLELFMLGIGRYTERDVKEAGRALTGWKIDYDGGRAHLSPASHDGGRKTILGVTQEFDAHSLVDFLLRQEDCSVFVAERLWFRYASSTEPIPRSTRDAMVRAFPDSMSMLRKLFEDDAFQATAGGLVKQPTEWFVGALRQLGLRPAKLSDDMQTYCLNGLDRLGQLVFAPPSVEGWPAGADWLTVGGAQVRLNLAGRIAQLVPVGRLTPEGVAHLLAVDTWTNRTYTAMKGTTDPQRLLTLGLASPEYLVT